MTADELSKYEKRIYYGTYQSNKVIRTKIDSLMRQMASFECTLGNDSTYEERQEVKNKQIKLLLKIKELDELKYDVLKKVI
tara:strand:- start:457 stop:699 length:243 start_codon:yes stop_codon:yes gene_type:complete